MAYLKAMVLWLKDCITWVAVGGDVTPIKDKDQRNINQVSHSLSIRLILNSFHFILELLK